MTKGKERIVRLRQSFLNSVRMIDVERAVIVTEAYQQHEADPQVVRKALALGEILQRMSIQIRDDELIVGNQSKNRRGVPLFPEYAIDWIKNDMDTFSTRKGDQFQITEGQKGTLRKIFSYWEGRTLRAKIKAALPNDLSEILEYGVFTNENYSMSGPGHMIPNYEFVIQNGLIIIKKECENYLEELELNDEDYENKYHLYKACFIVCDALIKWAKRYAQEAKKMAEEEGNEGRKKELLCISEVCSHVPAKPARNFWEALQCIYFLQVAIQIESNGLAIALGRLDQILFPYYKKDIEERRITKEDTLELIQCFFLKISEIDKVYSNAATRFLQGPAQGQTITLGGCARDGRDSINELSYLFIEADRDIRLIQPDLAVRITRTTPDNFLREVCINIRERLTKPKLFNDELIIQSNLNLGMSLEDARNWGALGCSESVVCGNQNSWGNSGLICLAKCLELALNDGKCMLTGKQMGPHTGKPNEFKTFEEILTAFKIQVEHFTKYLALYDNIIDHVQMQVVPLPLYSILTRDCLRTGIEFNRGGAKYNTTSPLGVGPITTGDSLAAIKKLVFKEKLITMKELNEVLINNFEGKENIRQMLLNRAPKFGNDEDIADDLCNEVLNIYCDELAKYKNARSGPFVAGLYYLSANIPFGLHTAATPDGRKARAALNDGGISPSQGRDKKSITAVAKSVGKLDVVRVHHGAILNQRFHPNLLEREDKLKLFIQYIRTFMDLGGWHVQFNVLTTYILRDAQNNPENYRDLVIRVAGYSAFFTDLESELQEDIIKRTEKVAY